MKINYGAYRQRNKQFKSILSYVQKTLKFKRVGAFKTPLCDNNYLFYNVKTEELLIIDSELGTYYLEVKGKQPGVKFH